MRTLAPAAVAALATVMCIAPAAADEQAEKEARALFKEGNKALEEARYVDALDLFRGAYARWSNPKILLNLGTALKALGRNAEAADTYEKYLADASAGNLRPVITLGVPLLFAERTALGVHGAAGLQWNASPKLGFFLDAGMQSFPGHAANEALLIVSIGAAVKL